MPQIECGSCQQKLPLRLTGSNEPAAIWLCARCNLPFIACCVKEALPSQSHLIRLDDRFFDLSGFPEMSLHDRQKAIRLASRRVCAAVLDKRRSERISQSLVVPAVRLGHGFVPEGNPFQLMVANLSCEGIGMVHDKLIDNEYIAIELADNDESPIQVIVRLVRHRELSAPYHEMGGEFLARLGSTTAI